MTLNGYEWFRSRTLTLIHELVMKLRQCRISIWVYIHPDGGISLLTVDGQVFWDLSIHRSTLQNREVKQTKFSSKLACNPGFWTG